MKKDISKLQFQSIVGFRGDSLVCPQAFGGDMFAGCSMGCWWCFCREMEHQLYNRYYDGWSRELVRPADPEDYHILFDKAFGSDKDYTDWNVKCLRRGLPFNMGSKAETFCVEDFQYHIVEEILKLFLQYKVPVIFETKSHYIGLQKYLDIIQEMNCAVIVAIMGGSDTLNYKLEPGSPPPSMRWKLVEQLNRRNIWTAVRWEPIMPGINSRPDYFKQYAQDAFNSGAKHISIFNYRTSNYKIAQVEFEKRGFNYVKMLEKNLDENWRPIGQECFRIMKNQGVSVSSPDFVNFPFLSDKESCCGVDGLFVPYHFNFQHACKLIKDKGSVSWEDMESIDFKEPKAYQRMKEVWNGRGNYYSLKDSEEIIVLDRDKAGMNIYGRKDPEQKTGLLF
jgi:DNA repair photolyase